jgi:hypothetical protein
MEESSAGGVNTSLLNLTSSNYSSGAWDNASSVDAADNRTSGVGGHFLSPHEVQLITMVSTAFVLGLVILATIIGELRFIVFIICLKNKMLDFCAKNRLLEDET